jgi:hypothetical protein
LSSQSQIAQSALPGEIYVDCSRSFGPTLQRFVVPALLILLMSPVVIQRTPTDIFPNINIPVIAVAWQYTGLNHAYCCQPPPSAL